MKKSLFVAALLLMSITLSAQEDSFEVSAAMVGTSMDYREYDDANVILDSEESKFHEVAGLDFTLDYAHKLAPRVYLGIEADISFMSGETKYVGAYLNTTQGYGSLVSVTKNTLFDTSVAAIVTHVLHHNMSISYGLGVGKHSWRRELSPSQVEVYSWYSLRPQANIEYSISDFVFAFGLEYQYGLNPTMAIAADSENPETTVNLGSANILQTSIPIYYRLTDNIAFFMEYVYAYQKIEKSNIVPYVIGGTQEAIYEPASTANNQYLKFGATFKF